MSVSKTLGLALVGLLFCAGCKSVNSERHALSEVVILGKTPIQINMAVEKVFSNHGYEVMQPGLTAMILEKKGSTGENIAYGNWMGTPVSIRVRTKIVPTGEGAFRLECTAARVRDAGKTLEEEMPVGRLKRGPYEKLLIEVASSLEGH